MNFVTKGYNKTLCIFKQLLPKMSHNKKGDAAESLYFQTISKIGVIADIQYCDEEDGESFSGDEIRRYREALNVTKRAATTFAEHQVGAVVQLGDAVDGKSKENFSRDFCERICPILEIPLPKHVEQKYTLSHSTIPRLDVIGNHELYCSTRQQLRHVLHYYDDEKDILCYSKVIASARWRIIVLDSYAVSLLGHTSEQEGTQKSVQFIEAENIILKNNPNVLGEVGKNTDWFEGLPTEKYRYVPYNGGIGKIQLQWLKEELNKAWNEKQFVVIFSHIPLSGISGHPKTLHWDMEEVLKLIKERGSHVVACVGGHRHKFDYQYNDEYETKCHHIDIPAPLVAPVGGEAYAVLEFSIKNIPIAKVNTMYGPMESQKVHAPDKRGTDATKHYNMGSLTETAELHGDKIMFHEGKILDQNEDTTCDISDEIAIVTVTGFGAMPKIMHLARQKPCEW